MTAHTYRTSLTLYAVWHPGPPPSEAARLARALHASFYRDLKRLLSRGLGIPVFFRGTPANPDGPPASIPLDSDEGAAEHTVIVLLIEDAFILDPAWEHYAHEFGLKVAGRPPGKHLVLPVQLGPNALDLGPLNSLRLTAHEPGERERRLITFLTHELCRLLLDQLPARDDAGQVGAEPSPGEALPQPRVPKGAAWRVLRRRAQPLVLGSRPLCPSGPVRHTQGGPCPSHALSMMGSALHFST